MGVIKITLIRAVIIRRMKMRFSRNYDNDDVKSINSRNNIINDNDSDNNDYGNIDK